MMPLTTNDLLNMALCISLSSVTAVYIDQATKSYEWACDAMLAL